MRKEIIIGIIGVIAVICFAVFLSWRYDKKFQVTWPEQTVQATQNPMPTPTPTPTPTARINRNSPTPTVRENSTPVPTATPTPSNIVSLTETEIAKHNKTSDCWLIINGGVYVATSFIPSHPGGAEKIISYCGQDATVAFETRGGDKESHSSEARVFLGRIYIGNLGGTATAQQILSAQQAF